MIFLKRITKQFHFQDERQTKDFDTLINFWPDQQDNEDARNGIEKSIETICKEEGISFEQVLYIMFCYTRSSNHSVWIKANTVMIFFNFHNISMLNLSLNKLKLVATNRSIKS